MATVPLAGSDEIIQVPLFVQGAVNTPGSKSVTMPGYSFPGNCITVNVFMNSHTIATIGSVTDNSPTGQSVMNPSGLGNVYQLAQFLNVAADGIGAVYLATNIAVPGTGYLTVTVNIPGSIPSIVSIQILEYSNVAFVSPIVHAVSATGTGTSVATPSVNTIVPNELLLAYLFSAGGSIVNGAPWTMRLSQPNVSGTVSLMSADNLADIPGFYAPVWSFVTGDWISLLTGLLSGSQINTVMRIAIGDTHPNIAADAGIVAPGLLKHGASAGDTIPNDMLRLYQQLYQLSESVPLSTGLDLSTSLAQGGSGIYHGQGS